MTDWMEYAKHGDLRSVIDCADERGLKNKYINLLQHKILSDVIGNDLQGKKVLDLGCGIGRFTNLLQSCGAEVTGVDFCEGMLSVYTGCKKICAPVDNLPFENNSFDAVISVWTLQYVDIKTLVKSSDEINRILSDNGTIYMIEQLSRHGYDSVFSRYLSDYVLAFDKFTMTDSRSIIRERDLIVGLVKNGLIPEFGFKFLIPYHLSITKNLILNNSDYIDQLMIFKKGVL